MSFIGLPLENVNFFQESLAFAWALIFKIISIFASHKETKFDNFEQKFYSPVHEILIDMFKYFWALIY